MTASGAQVPGDDERPQEDTGGQEASDAYAGGGAQAPVNLADVLQAIAKNPGVAEQIISRPGVMALISTFSGPLPHPELLQGYESTLPGSAERIVAMAEKYQDHQIGLERQQSRANTEFGRRGQRYGLIVAFGAFALAAYVAYLGQPAVAGVVAALDITALVGVFVLGNGLPLRRGRTGKSASEGGSAKSAD